MLACSRPVQQLSPARRLHNKSATSSVWNARELQLTSHSCVGRRGKARQLHGEQARESVCNCLTLMLCMLQCATPSAEAPSRLSVPMHLARRRRRHPHSHAPTPQPRPTPAPAAIACANTTSTMHHTTESAAAMAATRALTYTITSGNARWRAALRRDCAACVLQGGCCQQLADRTIRIHTCTIRAEAAAPICEAQQYTNVALLIAPTHLLHTG